MVRREKSRDARDFDTTQLKEGGHGSILHRDYSAHFFRWCFARRLIKPTDVVLEVGCGEDKPLSRILLGGVAKKVGAYTGVDLNKLKPSNSQSATFHGEFNFVSRYKELLRSTNNVGYDVVVHLEVLEHMSTENGLAMLKACKAVLKPGGMMIMSTPCYDGVRHAANHIHEYTIEELGAVLEKVGFAVENRFGTFMDIKHIGKVSTGDDTLDAAVKVLRPRMAKYFDNDAISNFFACLYPDVARNNLWVCRKP